jgi:hypothetical protein
MKPDDYARMAEECSRQANAMRPGTERDALMEKARNTGPMPRWTIGWPLGSCSHRASDPIGPMDTSLCGREFKSGRPEAGRLHYRAMSQIAPAPMAVVTILLVRSR